MLCISFMVRPLGRTDTKICYTLLHTEEFASLHPYCVCPLFIFAKAANLISTLRIEWRTEKRVYKTKIFLCEVRTSLSSLRKGQSEKLIAVICMWHKVHQSHWMLKALAGSQSAFLTPPKFPSMSSYPLVYVLCSVYMPRWTGDELLEIPARTSVWMHTPVS